MFANFIYFIVALLIYSTSPAPDAPSFTPFQTFFLFSLLVVFFMGLTRVQFKTLERQAESLHRYHFDHRFHQILNRQSVVAIAIFAADIYGLNLQAYSGELFLFRKIPTLEAVAYLALFMGYLSIVWANAYPAYHRFNHMDIGRWAYVFSNISFSIPVLLPWVLLSGVADVIMILPFEWPKQFLSTAGGQFTYFAFFLILVAVLGPLMIQRFWGCKPLEPGRYRTKIEQLCQKAGVRYADILYWPIFGGRMITAGVMGIFHRFRYILVTKALLNSLEPDELEAVIGHEIGHVKKRHLQYYLIFFSGLTLLLFYAAPLFDWFVRIIGITDESIRLYLLSIFVIAVFIFYFRFIFGYFMRNFERQADVYVYSLFRNAKPLIATFKKIALLSGQPPDKPNWHHFSISERMGYLEKCEEDKGWISRQDRKIRKSLGVYLAALTLLVFTGYQMVYGAMGNAVSIYLLERQLNEVLSQKEPDANLYLALGDLYFNHNEYGKAIDYYRESLALAPSNPNALNNLAWLYATCEDLSFRDKTKALQLSEKAVSLEPQSPHILDTYAESLFINGAVREAIHYGEMALKLAKHDRHIYEKQLKKYRKALQ